MYFKLVKQHSGLIMALILSTIFQAHAQHKTQGDIHATAYPDDASFRVKTYVNPVIAGDHPDPTLLKVGDDFYMCGSSFHFLPNLPILHSRDLIHWETISRVVPADWKDLKSGIPGAGIWQGAISYFYGSYRIYFSNGSGDGQYFSTAANPAGPWTIPVKVKATAETGSTGYDNSIFVDNDGTPYMIIKTGQTTNRIQQVDSAGNLTGKLINLDWINHDKKYSWAEGPVMCKRDGWYYYLMAGDVTGGQYALRSRTLTADSSKWENMGNVFAFSKDPQNRFRSVNHMSSPVQLSDGTWWCLAQSYDSPKDNDWSGQGRQDLLLQVQWTDSGKPFVPYPSDQPLARPKLPNSGSRWCLPLSDNFDSASLKLLWHFLNKTAASKYSLTDRPGWLRIKPQSARSHILQKEAGHNYALVTRVDINPSTKNEQAGIYLTSGNETENVRLYSGYDDGGNICFEYGKQYFSIKNTIGQMVWLKLERKDHNLSGFCSADGITWTHIGNIDATGLDKAQPDYNSWVGTSAGLFAQNKPADFDLFLYRDGFTPLPATGSNNYFGVKLIDNTVIITNEKGGWLMFGGVDIGHPAKYATSVSITASAIKQTVIEVWINDIEGRGKRIALIPITPTGSPNNWKSITAKISQVSGQHDVYIRVPASGKALRIKTLKFN